MRKGSTSGGKAIKMGTGRAATDIGQEAVSGGPEADGAVAMVAQVGGPEADGGADGGSDYVMRGNICLSLLRKDRGPSPVHGCHADADA